MTKTTRAKTRVRTGAAQDPAAEPAARTTRRPAARTPRLPKTVTGIIQAAQDRKATDLVVLDLRKAGGFTDYFVICTGRNPRQIAAIADAVTETLRTEYDERPALTEGLDRSEWILLDYFNVVVHIFSPECRAFYGLERLWGNADRIEIPDTPA